VLVNLSDLEVKSGHPGVALQAVEQGLVRARQLGDGRVEAMLLHNGMLARVALGRSAEARRDFELLQASWAEAGATGQQVSTLREFSDALASAGDLAGALDMHRRERLLAKQLAAANQDAALAELRSRFNQEAQQRSILLLERDNAVKGAELANQRLTRSLWALASGVIALAMLLVLQLLRRMRETSRALAHSQARLRVQSERDALTGLANRRHFHAVLDRDARGHGFEGALLMLDIDHFKHINDEHGHGAGDRVLVELARRVSASVRGQDIVVRWGGEEFLVLAPGLQLADTRALAQRLLQAVAGPPVELPDGQPLRVTASIGHAVFPLAPHHVRLTPEQAINLADMALYTAKSHGRNRAVGIVHIAADDDAGLRALEADFERAFTEGRVSLQIDPGPSAEV
jgi:diguanylate cyclase (GGDEF)-like protein